MIEPFLQSCHWFHCGHRKWNIFCRIFFVELVSKYKLKMNQSVSHLIELKIENCVLLAINYRFIIRRQSFSSQPKQRGNAIHVNNFCFSLLHLLFSCKKHTHKNVSRIIHMFAAHSVHNSSDDNIAKRCTRFGVSFTFTISWRRNTASIISATVSNIAAQCSRQPRPDAARRNRTTNPGINVWRFHDSSTQC